MEGDGQADAELSRIGKETGPARMLCPKGVLPQPASAAYMHASRAFFFQSCVDYSAPTIGGFMIIVSRVGSTAQAMLPCWNMVAHDTP